MHEESKKAGQPNSWGVWSRWPDADNWFQVVVVDGYTKFSDITGTNYKDLMGKVIAGKKPGETYDIAYQVNITDDVRKIIKSEIWDVVDGTTPKM